MPYVRPSEVGDAARLAPYLRKADLVELNAATEKSPKESLSLGYFLSNPCRSIVDEKNGHVIGMFGVSPMKTEGNTKFGAIWLLSNDALVTTHKRWFIRSTENWIYEICKPYDKVLNFVHPTNHKHIRWLKAVGFNVAGKPSPFGYKEELFYYFEKVITDV